jgi:hypothetical protein
VYIYKYSLFRNNIKRRDKAQYNPRGNRIGVLFSSALQEGSGHFDGEVHEMFPQCCHGNWMHGMIV